MRYNTPTDIGNSKKKHSSNRGFRGIGRLGGLSYCDKLVLLLYNGENIKSTIVFNCKTLRELLVPGEYDHYNLTRIIRESSFTQKMKMKQNIFYCRNGW